MRKGTIRAAAAAIIFGIGSAASASEVTVETARGEATVQQNPSIVAVFDIAAVDTLEALEIEAQGLPDKIYVGYLDDARAAAQPVGTLFEPDFEALNAMQPDLIVAGGRSSTQVEALSALAPTIDMTIWGEGLLDQARQRIAAYGEIFDKQAAAKELDDRLLAALEKTRAVVSDGGNALIVLTNGPKVSAYGPGSRFGWLHTELGIEPAAAGIEASIHGEAISFEFIREIDPDWLIVIDRAAAIGSGSSGAQRTLDNKLVADTRAWKSGQVIYLDPGKVYIAAGGYQALMGTLAQLADAFSKGE